MPLSRWEGIKKAKELQMQLLRDFSDAIAIIFLREIIRAVINITVKL